MPSLNQITIVGNCGGDPEMRFLPDGTQITEFSIAVDNGKFVNEDWKEDTIWFRVSCFGKLAERVNQKIKKGDPTLCIGKLIVDKWKDNNTGENRFTLKVKADKIVNFSKAKTQGGSQVIEGSGDINPEDLPF